MTTNRESKSINASKDEGIIEHFRKNIGRRVFILTEAFPFMFIGTIKSLTNDMALLAVETTSIPALEGKEWTLHIHSIDVFYIETGLGPKIPELKD
ncbi:hypothetical protein JSQ81_08485 [Sporosarcina sp. Marseille-Q4063]|uniref:hypothetical protein n=1 Tax=Sporosarcina sp. Marseille-Q4063 TaxID=2810514 RepID=UPI001BAFE44C|nr:hypothetical protein [Sporosarcina sp. Marseille-Q4063]QUW23522.1 hypothetical protein JSQ81_08485 [Sporosarcina sp. Marseille-Q4063]